MPEGPEVDTDSLHETIHEKLEHEGGSFLRSIALSTAVLAAFAAVASLQAGATVNEALVLKSDATTFQAEASDQWAYYQAKGIKAAVEEASRAAYEAAGKAPPAAYEEAAGRYAREQQEIQKQAQELEHKRDEKGEEAGRLLERHHKFANAVALFQIAIALGAVAALTRIRVVWWGSMATGLAAIILFGMPYLRG